LYESGLILIYTEDNFGHTLHHLERQFVCVLRIEWWYVFSSLR